MRRASESWWLFTQTDWRSGINKSHQSIVPSICVCLLHFCISGCVCVFRSFVASINGKTGMWGQAASSYPSLCLFHLLAVIHYCICNWLRLRGDVFKFKAKASSRCVASYTGPVSPVTGREECEKGRKETHTHRHTQTALFFALSALVSRILYFLWLFPLRHTHTQTNRQRPLLTTLVLSPWSSAAVQQSNMSSLLLSQCLCQGGCFKSWTPHLVF